MAKLEKMRDEQKDEDGCFVGCIMQQYGAVSCLSFFFFKMEMLNDYEYLYKSISSLKINEAGQMIRAYVQVLVEAVADETIKENIRTHLDEFDEVMAKATDPCMAGKIAQTFEPFMDAMKLLYSKQ